MANSLRAKLSKLRHDGNITDAEYQALIKKLDGHDAEIRAKAIDKLVEEAMKRFTYFDLKHGYPTVTDCKVILRDVAEQLKGGAT